MKTLLGIFLLLPLFAFSQFNYKKVSLSLGGGATVPHTDITDFSFAPVISGGAHYNISPYAAIGIDVETGKLEGNYSTLQNTSEGPRNVPVNSFTNKFLTAAVDARLQMGQFTGREVSGFSAVLSRLYAGTGMGIVRSDAESQNPDEITRQYKSTDFIVPVFAGLNIPLLKELDLEILTLFLNYRLNISFSDDLDALDHAGSTSDDYFSSISAGVRFNIGPRSPYFYGRTGR
ncbi:MAG TPA: outer membrane beta-barrel protein [Anseongella sp.]|nr:outer membrane beta-barrel protein [Anseongella sp.]